MDGPLVNRRVVGVCPVCGQPLAIRRFGCGQCGTTIDSTVPVPPFFRLPDELQLFVLVFLRCRGNIREVEKVLGISYPTVCKRLDQVNLLLGQKAPAEGEPALPDRNEILQRLKRGEITAKQAAELLKGKASP